MAPRGPYKKVSNEDKERIFQCYERSGDYLHLADQLSINRCTAYSIVRRGVKNEGRVNKARGGVRRSKLTAEMRGALLTLSGEPDSSINCNECSDSMTTDCV